MTNPPKAKHRIDIDMLEVDYCEEKSKYNAVMKYNSQKKCSVDFS